MILSILQFPTHLMRRLALFQTTFVSIPTTPIFVLNRGFDQIQL